MFYRICVFIQFQHAALKTLHDVLIDGILGDYTPCLSNVMLKEEASNVLTEKETHRKRNLVTALFDDPAVSGSLPSNLGNATLANLQNLLNFLKRLTPWICSIQYKIKLAISIRPPDRDGASICNGVN